MKVINKRQDTQMRLVDIPYGTVYLDSTDEPKMKVCINGHDYAVNLKTGDAYRIIDNAMVITVEAVLTIS